MSVHYNVQIHIQRVEKSDVTQSALVEQGGGKRDVTEVFDIKVTADSEVEAYKKARRILYVAIGSVD